MPSKLETMKKKTERQDYIKISIPEGRIKLNLGKLGQIFALCKIGKD